MAGKVHVKGLRETQRAFRQMADDSRKELREGLKKAVDPVRTDAASLFAPINARTAAGFRVAVRARGVSVEQRLKRTTGQHPEYGARQMTEALLPALDRREDRIIDDIEDVLDGLARRNGF